MGKKGSKLLESTKQKISNSLKGSKNPQYGKPLSEEHKRKISETLKKYHKNKKGQT